MHPDMMIRLLDGNETEVPDPSNNGTESILTPAPIEIVGTQLPSPSPEDPVSNPPTLAPTFPSPSPDFGGDDGGDGFNPVFPSPPPTLAPIIADGGTLADLEQEARDAAQKFGFVVLGAVLAFTFCLFWRCCVCCKQRREKRMLRLASARADNVLGDMQMVPNDEYDDDDPELL